MRYMPTNAGNADNRGIHQVIDASEEDVFDAWITPHILEQWWGPDGFTTRVLELNAIEGGRFVFEMTAPDGASCLMTGWYRTIERPSLLVFEIVDHCNLNLPEGVEPQLSPSLVTVKIARSGTATHTQMSHTLLEPSYEQIAIASWSSVLMKLDLCF